MNEPTDHTADEGHRGQVNISLPSEGPLKEDPIFNAAVGIRDLLDETAALRNTKIFRSQNIPGSGIDARQANTDQDRNDFSGSQEQPSDTGTTEAKGHNKSANLKEDPPKEKLAFVAADTSDISDGESTDTMKTELNYNLKYPSLALPLKERIKKAPKRSLQQLVYAKLVEDRITDLEGRLEKIELKAAVVKESPDISEPEPETQAILGLNRITFEEYKYRGCKSFSDGVASKSMQEAPYKHADALDNPSHHVIDVIYDQANNSEMFLNGLPGIQSQTGTLNTISSGPHNAIEGSEDPTHKTPQRIGINSSLLIEALEAATGCKLDAIYDMSYSLTKSRVILRPFKLLVVYEKEIRDFALALAEKYKRDNAEASREGISGTANLVTSSIAEGAISGASDASDGSRRGSSDIKDVAPKPLTEPEAKKAGVMDRLQSMRCHQELQNILELFNQDLKRTFELRQQIDEATVHVIEFSDLWHLFRHGALVCANSVPSQVLCVLNVEGGRQFLSDKRDFSLSTRDPLKDDVELNIGCFSYGSNGGTLIPAHHSWHIKQYEGSKPIVTLPIFPIQYSYLKGENLDRAGLVTRGRRYVELSQITGIIKHKIYDGLAFDMDQSREEVSSQVIIDAPTAVLKNPSLELHLPHGIINDKEQTSDPRETTELIQCPCRPKKCVSYYSAIYQDSGIESKLSAKIRETRTKTWDLSEELIDMTEEDFMICSCYVYGYALRSRKWMSLDVRFVNDIKEPTGGFDALVLPKGHKETLLALVETHSMTHASKTGRKAPDRQVDLVKGKGRGLIILLHGEPGVGKTSTAENVAEHTNRPLFQVTCGDIGTTAEAVERTLENHFQLAHKWGCVLLLDEADVFLMSRDKNDLQRNAIVSVFLRVLEYYSGILFLTTNRVGVFDQAFRSRIHMSFFYPKLDKTSTVKIWKMNLDRTQKQWGENIKISPDQYQKILDYADDHFKELETLHTTWNGRQIRNAFQTAIALAEYSATKTQQEYNLPEAPTPVLKVEHFEKVADASKHFDEYLRQTTGQLMADKALESQERRDDLREEDIARGIAQMSQGQA